MKIAQIINDENLIVLENEENIENVIPLINGEILIKISEDININKLVKMLNKNIVPFLDLFYKNFDIDTQDLENLITSLIWIDSTAFYANDYQEYVKNCIVFDNLNKSFFDFEDYESIQVYKFVKNCKYESIEIQNIEEIKILDEIETVENGLGRKITTYNIDNPKYNLNVYYTQWENELTFCDYVKKVC